MSKMLLHYLGRPEHPLMNTVEEKMTRPPQPQRLMNTVEDVIKFYTL